MSVELEKKGCSESVQLCYIQLHMKQITHFCSSAARFVVCFYSLGDSVRPTN